MTVEICLATEGGRMSDFSNGLTCLSIQTSLKTGPREGAGYIHAEVYAWMVCYFHLSFSINSFCPIHFFASICFADDENSRPKVRKVKLVDEKIPKVDKENRNDKVDFDTLVDLESGGDYI